MPKSKSKRDPYIPPKKPNPTPSPRWVPIAGTSLIALGIVVILVNYIFPGFLPGGNYWIFGGFIFMAVGLGILSQWR